MAEEFAVKDCKFYTTVVVPLGWQVVPPDPTMEMLDELTNGDAQKRNVMKLRYAQMLKAAPHPDSDEQTDRANGGEEK